MGEREALMKLYCDAAFWEANKQAKLGIVLKNNKKRIYENSIILNDIMDSVEAEFHAIYKGILALKELGIFKANILSDSKSNIAMIKGRGRIKEKYRYIVALIDDLKREMSLKFQWIPRNKNQIAHDLTR
jgi:ribonuclease HI